MVRKTNAWHCSEVQKPTKTVCSREHEPSVSRSSSGRGNDCIDREFVHNQTNQTLIVKRSCKGLLKKDIA